MERVNDLPPDEPPEVPRSDGAWVVQIRCAACRRSLGRWGVDEATPDLIYPSERPPRPPRPGETLRDWQARLARGGVGFASTPKLVVVNPSGRREVLVTARPRRRRWHFGVVIEERPADERGCWERVSPDVLDLTCSCHRGLQRRRVRISSQGLLRLLRRLGWPEVVEL